MQTSKVRRFSSTLYPAIMSALIAPGVGQIINREYSKAVLLLATFFGSFIWFSKVVTEQLALLLPGTPDQWMKDQPQLKEAIVKLADQYTSMFLTFQLLILTVWLFGVADAYFTARKRLTMPSSKGPLNENQSENEP